MKMKRLLTNFGIAVTVAVVSLVFLNAKSTQNYVPRDINSNDANGMKEWFKSRRADYNTGKIDYNYVKEVEKQVLAQRNAKHTNDFELKWQESGPDKVGGRTRAILVDKNNNQNIYAGSVSGGLWKSTNGAQTWFKINDKETNLSVSSICQTDNGNIYYGTGEQVGTGYIGNGIYKSTDGINFTNIPSTSNFSFVYKLVAHNNTIYASTNKGLYKSTDGDTWTVLKSTTYLPNDFKRIDDVAISNDGILYASVKGKIYKSTDGGSTLNIIDSIPTSNAWNVKIDIAPSNSNYVYCSVVYMSFNNPFGSGYQDFNIYRTTDGGINWTSIRGEYTASFQPFKKQGSYNHVIKVFPKNENKILLGGVDSYSWDDGYGWQQISYWIGDQGINSESYYMHADQHTILFDPEYNGTTNRKIYFGNDGGIFISKNDASTFTSYNLKYNVTQFYTVAAGPKGKWVAGAQDNGTQYNSLEGSNKLRTSEVSGGDGFGCAIPMLSEKLKFVSLYYGKIYRITESGEKQSISVTGEDADFVTNIALWESMYDETSIDSVIFVVEDKGLHVGDTVIARSNQGRRPLPYILTAEDSIATGDTIFPLDFEIKVWDTYQSLFAYPTHNGIFISTRALNLSTAAIYFDKVSDVAGSSSNAQNLVFSKDGNTIFYSLGNKVYKTTNLLNSRKAKTEAVDPGVTVIDINKVVTQQIGAFPGTVTSIATDPEVSNNLIVTLGGYNTGAHIYYSTNAATTVSENLTDNFIDVTGNLPGIPVYSSLIAWNSSNRVVIGTEYGIYSTDAITDGANTLWVVQDNGLPNVSVTGLFQQTFKNEWENGVTNHGYIYAATFGRGVFISKSNAGPVGIDELTSSKDNNAINIVLYPNPTSDIANIKLNLNKRSNINVEIYSITGKKVFANNYNGIEGNNNITLNTNTFNAGTYFVKVSTITSNEVVKMIVK